MKKIAMLLILVVSLVSCTDDKEFTVKTDLTQFSLTEKVTIDVKENYTTVVKMNDVILYEGNMPLTIDVPKQLVKTKAAGQLDVDYVIEESNGKKFNAYKSGVLLFEDVSNGDNDYNDFVCYVDERIEFKGHDNKGVNKNLKYNVTIKPLAMGNSLPVSFGVELIVDGRLEKDYLLVSDCRATFYDNLVGYINTDYSGEYKIGNTISDKNYQGNGNIEFTSSFATNYYIVVDGGRKRYVCDSSKAAPTDGGVPYGLFIPLATTFDYPLETKSFFEAYPNFMKWVKGENVAPFSDPNTTLLYSKE